MDIENKIPTVNDFVEYFDRNYPNEKQKKMLLLNYFSPNHTITSGTMGYGMDYKNFSAANLHYGTYAGVVAESMGFDLPDPKCQISFFVDFDSPEFDINDRHLKWIMRKSLVEAIEKLGWATNDAKKEYERNLSFARALNDE